MSFFRVYYYSKCIVHDIMNIISKRRHFLKVKKLITAIFIATLAFATVGPMISNNVTTADARGYKSGKSGFNTNKSTTNNNSNTQDKSKTDSKTTNSSAAQKSKSGGLMKGLMLGGLAGLLFGGLLAGMGGMGQILGLIINVIGILVIILLVSKIITMFRNKNKKDERHA